MPKASVYIRPTTGNRTPKKAAKGGYWSHRQSDAQIVSNLTVQCRLKLF